MAVGAPFVVKAGAGCGSAACEDTSKKSEKKTVENSDPWAFLPDVLATVGKQKITKTDFMEVLKSQNVPVNQIPPDMLKKFSKQLVDNLVEKRILLKMAEKGGIKPSKELVAKEYDTMMKDMPEDYKAQMKQHLASQGISMEDYKKKMMDDPNAQEGMAISAWIKKEYSDKMIKGILEADVEKFYKEHQDMFASKPETVKASHILVKATEESEKAAAKKKAEEILVRVNKGEDFGKLAEELSDCPSGKQAKGSLGEFGRGQMVPEFEKVAFELEPGKTSGVVETQFGYHIIKTEAHNKGATKPLKEVAEKIKQMLVGEKVNAVLEKDLKAEKEKMKVKVFI